MCRSHFHGDGKGTTFENAILEREKKKGEKGRMEIKKEKKGKIKKKVHWV